MRTDRLVLVLATQLGCGADDTPLVAAEADPVAAVLVGCARADVQTCMRPQPGPATRCESTRRTGDGETFAPVVWIADGHDGDEVVVEGESTARIQGRATADGLRFELDVPANARTIAIVRAGTVVRHWTLLDPPVEPDVVATARSAIAMSAAERDRVTGALEEALPGLAEADRATALDVLADVRFRRADAAEAEDRAERWRDALRATHEAHAFAVGRDDHLRARCHARRGVFIALEHTSDAEAIEHWSGQLATTTDAKDPGAALDAYSRGLVAHALGDLQLAAREFGAAEAGAVRFADRKLAAAAAQLLATVLASLGREEEAAAALDRADQSAQELDCRTWLRTTNNTSWARVLLREGGGAADDPVPDLANASTLLEAAVDPGDECHDERLAEHVRLGLALVAASEGAIGWAQQLRAELPHELAAADDTTAWRVELDRRLALATGDRGALTEWVATHGPRADPTTPDDAWARAWGRGQIFEALDAPDDALASYDEAERVLSAMMWNIDFDGGRDRLLLGRQRSAGRRVALLVARGDAEQALCAARIARARTSRVLDRSARIGALSPDERREWLGALAHHAQLERELDDLRGRRWSIPLDRRPAHDASMRRTEALAADASRRATTMIARASELDDLATCADAPSEVLSLTFFPVADEQGWIAFAFDEDGVTAHGIESMPGAGAELERWSAVLLEPFRRRIASASALRILPTGPLWDVPFSALPWDGDVLLAARPITFALDLARRAPLEPAPDRRALLVADPRGDLPAAQLEADGVARALQAGGWSVTELRADAVRSPVVRAELARVELLHYAGHGRHAGLEGWEGALDLADGARLGVADILALPSVPRQVVLPACDTAPSDAATLGGGMNVARAFLLAGADAVIAARGPIADELAARVAVASYATNPIDASTAAERLRSALLAARGDPSLAPVARAQWSRIVLMVP